jgi:hypothetical protein
VAPDSLYGSWGSEGLFSFPRFFFFRFFAAMKVVKVNRISYEIRRLDGMEIVKKVTLLRNKTVMLLETL